MLTASVSAAATEFYYFNPDSTQSNLANLKRDMDAMLAGASAPITFQPFARLRDFDQKVLEGKPAFLLLPAWYLQEGDNLRKFKPLLVSKRQGSSTYRKVLLVSRQSEISVHDLGRKTIAMTSMGPEGHKLLNKIIFSHHGLDSRQLNIVITSKDSDALFALALQQVDAALVSKDNLELIGEINPRIPQAVRPLAESDPIPLPIVCYTRETIPPTEVEEVKRIFLNGQQGRKNSNLMDRLQFEVWQNDTP